MTTFKEYKEASPHGMSAKEYAKHELGGAKKPKLGVGSKVNVMGNNGIVKEIFSRKTSVGTKKFMKVDHNGKSEDYRLDTTRYTLRD